MKRDDRKAAIAAYKERAPAVGVFAIHCPAEDLTWVGTSKDLDKIRNRIWFSLRIGKAPQKELQRIWAAHGEDGLQFEELERLDKDLSDLARERILKERLAHWADARRAAVI